jgi:hypothetical protein
MTESPREALRVVEKRPDGLPKVRYGFLKKTLPETRVQATKPRDAAAHRVELVLDLVRCVRHPRRRQVHHLRNV